MTDLPKQTLVLSVWDKDYGKSNDYLGKKKSIKSSRKAHFKINNNFRWIRIRLEVKRRKAETLDRRDKIPRS